VLNLWTDLLNIGHLRSTMASIDEATYANVNGLTMHYKIVGEGPQLVLIHGGGSTIATTFTQIMPHLAKHYKILAMDLQGHGKTKARAVFSGNTTPEDAEDVYALMQEVGFHKAHIFGFSKGGASAMYLATRHPEVVDRLVIAGIFCRKGGAIPGFWDGFQNATVDMMPPALRDAYLVETDNDVQGLQTMFELDCKSMVAWEDWSDEDLKKIQAKTLVLAAFNDVVTPEHALHMARTILNAELVILRGNHGEHLGDVSSNGGQGSRMPEFTAELLHEFLSDNS
jgi:pimeloyl-ACP methyl ester carboxylesterase